MKMIPNHLALVPVNHFHYAASQAIILVEDKKKRGKCLKRYPYASALITIITDQKGPITSVNMKRALPDYPVNPRERQNKEAYISALDILIESQGEICLLPLSSSTVDQYFPATKYKLQERRNRIIDTKNLIANRQREKERQKKRRRYQSKLAQANVELAYITPSELQVWYHRQNKQGIFEDDLIDMLLSWSARFTKIDLRCLSEGTPLWVVMKEMKEMLSSRSFIERWLDEMVRPNKLRAHNE
ncbi:plasmid SOS inhibition protein A [Xenorhabdus siamensis]|uniref:plasmid SOS inhibition protein A n=1 Tax=Xenorhabdus siamensis TaxID=3136254 RepID=UPI0030F46F26